jgi:hypothetical protein
MKFQKYGKIFHSENINSWWTSHAMAPTPILLNDKKLRVFVGALNKEGISSIAYVDLNAENLKEVKNVCLEPILVKGEPGTFDENGVFPASIYKYKNKIFLYYTGFQLGAKVRYYMFGGLAISRDNGNTFDRISKVPVMDRSDEGLFFRGGPSIIFDEGKFKVFYSSGSTWENIGGKKRPTYDIYSIESCDGINIGKKGQLCLSYNRENEHGLGRPQIIKRNNKYQLFYTRRTKDMKYWSGYSESVDGVNWIRKDNEIGITHSSSGWDSDMVYFPNIIDVLGKTYLFYNGNEFGKEGFGIAELIEE